MPGDTQSDELEPANWRMKNTAGIWPRLLLLWWKTGKGKWGWEPDRWLWAAAGEHSVAGAASDWLQESWMEPAQDGLQWIHHPGRCSVKEWSCLLRHSFGLVVTALLQNTKSFRQLRMAAALVCQEIVSTVDEIMAFRKAEGQSIRWHSRGEVLGVLCVHQCCSPRRMTRMLGLTWECPSGQLSYQAVRLWGIFYQQRNWKVWNSSSMIVNGMKKCSSSL